MGGGRISPVFISCGPLRASRPGVGAPRSLSTEHNLPSSEWRMKSLLTSILLVISIQFNDIVNNQPESLVRRAPGQLQIDIFMTILQI